MWLNCSSFNRHVMIKETQYFYKKLAPHLINLILLLNERNKSLYAIVLA